MKPRTASASVAKCGRPSSSKARERRRHVQHQDGVVLLVVEEDVEGGAVPGGVRVADDVDRVRARPDRRQCAIERGERLRRNRR
jgi:hypothetical protein